MEWIKGKYTFKILSCTLVGVVRLLDGKQSLNSQGAEVFHFASISRPFVGPTQPFIQ
jgi:hypothetical protein